MAVGEQPRYLAQEDRHRFCSTGVSVDATVSAGRHARRIMPILAPGLSPAEAMCTIVTEYGKVDLFDLASTSGPRP
jgi:hypothetical protein